MKRLYTICVLIASLVLGEPSRAEVTHPGGGGSSLSAGYEITWANNFSNSFLIGGGGTRKWSIYDDVTNGLQWVCVVAGVENDCNYIRKLAAGKYWEVQNSSGTSIFRVTESTGALTNVTMDIEANTITRPFQWDLDLCAISPSDSSTSHVWNKDPLSTAPTLTAKAGTNRSTCVATFPDSDGDYGVGISRFIPPGTFTGNFDAYIVWDTTGTGNARFQIQTKCYADDEADDAAMNTASVVTAAAGTSGRPNIQVITGITTTGCAAGEIMRIRFYRNRTEASDTLNAALNVEKVVFIGRVK